MSNTISIKVNTKMLNSRPFKVDPFVKTKGVGF